MEGEQSRLRRRGGEANGRLTIDRIRAGSPVLRTMEDDRTVRILGATRDIGAGAVDLRV